MPTPPRLRKDCGARDGVIEMFLCLHRTGIGTGILFDGRVYYGRTGAAAEGGHVSIDYNGPRCGCGKKRMHRSAGVGHGDRQKGAGETRGKGRMLAGDACARRWGHERSHGRNRGTGLRGRRPACEEILLETVELLAIWLGNIVDLLEPDVMILGGGVATMLSPFYDEIRRRLPAWCVNQLLPEIPLVPARYGANAGIAGGAALCAGRSLVQADLTARFVFLHGKRWAGRINDQPSPT